VQLLDPANFTGAATEHAFSTSRRAAASNKDIGTTTSSDQQQHSAMGKQQW